MVFDGIDAVERKGGEQGYPDDGLAHLGDGLCIFISQQVSSQARFGALGVFEFHNRNALDGFFPDAKKACGDLCDHMIVVRPHPFHETALARAREGIPCHCCSCL